MAAKSKSKAEALAPVDAPLPLVTVDSHGKFVVGSEAFNLIRQIKGDVAVIAVAGIYRTGKSYILNRLLGKQQGFAVGPTVNPCTKGIYIWGRPIVLQREGDEPLSVLLVDTEGIGSIQQDQTYDVKIFSLAILLSSYFVYNSMSIIDERALDGLSLVVNLTKQISTRSNTGGGKANGKGKAAQAKANGETSASELADYFPHFLWLLRDFALDLVDDKGAPITSRQYLENALRERPEPAQQSKNAIRSTIKQLFRERDCVALVRPVVDEKQLKTIDAIPYAQLRPEFRQQSDELVQKILDEAPAKQINGQNLTGESFAQLLHIYTDSINAGAVASIQSAWESLSAQVNQQAMEEAQHAWTSGINARYNPNRPLNDDHLQALHLECMNEAFGIYDAMCYHGPPAAAMRKQLKAKMVAEFARLVQSNREASSRFVLRLLGTLYEPLEASAKSGQYTSLDALLEAWQGLQKKFFEHLGDSQASRVVAYDEFLKFYTTNLLTTGSHVMKAIKDTHTQQIEQLKKKLDSLTAEKHATELASVKAIEENKRLVSQLSTAEKSLKTLEANLATANENWKSAQTQLTKATTEASKAMAEANKAIAEVKKAQSHTLAAEVKFNNEIDSVKAALKEKSKSYDEKVKELEATKKRIETLETVVSTMKQSLEKTEKSATDKLKATEQTMQSDKQKLQTSLDKALREKDAMEAREKVLKDNIQDLQDKLVSMTEDLKDTKVQTESAVGPLKKQVQELKKALEESKSETARALAQAEKSAAAKSSADKVERALVSMTRERDDANGERDALKREVALLHNKHVAALAPLSEELETKIAEVAELKRELAKVKQQAAAASAQLNKAKATPPAPIASSAPSAASSASRPSTKASSSSAPSTAIHRSAMDEDEDNDRDFDDASSVASMASDMSEIDGALITKGKKKTATAAKRTAKTAASSKAAPKASSSKKTSRTTALPDLDEYESSDDEELAMASAVAPVARTSTAASSSTPRRGRASRAPAPEPVATSSNHSDAMDVDIDLPAPKSRKRTRPSDFSETAEVPEHEVETPSKNKKSQNDPLKMDKTALKSTLTAAGVKLPPGDHSKAHYVELFNAKFNANKKK
jgi:hypothetical protein